MWVGADLNIQDNDGDTPFTCCFKENNTYVTERTRRIFINYIDKLEAAGIYINPVNKDCRNKIMISSDENVYLNTLDMMNIKIDESLFLRYILTEKMVMKFNFIASDKCKIILKYLEYQGLHKKFPEWSPIFKLQRLKILKRVKMFIPAFNALKCLLDQRLPVNFVNSVLEYLNNDDWNSIIQTQNRRKIF